MATMTDAAPLTGHHADRAVAAADPLLRGYLAAAAAWYSAVVAHDGALESMRIHLQDVHDNPRMQVFHERRGARLSARLSTAHQALMKARGRLLAAYERLADPAVVALARHHALAGAGAPVHGVPAPIASEINMMRMAAALPVLEFPTR